ncbi:MAG: RIP metalloprotease RseP [Rickettsiales bacterium]|nr:RIP metalloprotease RseP [Rickettsiales bacterium]
MMDIILPYAHMALAFVLILSVIVFIHEFGHYLVARLCGVRITDFSIGFGREIFGFHDRHGTRWKFSLLPLGGYVKMFGDASEASTSKSEQLNLMSEAERKVSFHYQPLYKKAFIVTAGPLFNFILTIGIFTFFVFTNGLETTEPLVGDVIAESPAAAAGLQSGDRILQVDGKKVARFTDIPLLIITNVGKPVRLLYERDGEPKEVMLTPQIIEESDGLGNISKRPLIGIKSMRMTFEDVGVVRAVGESVKKTWDLSLLTFDYIGQLVTGQRTPDELKGPIGIAKMSGQALEKGWMTVLWFMALLSANLGLINLFPIPPLDGGHLMYYMLQAARGRPMAERYQEMGYRAGFALILMLMAFTIYNDIRQF